MKALALAALVAAAAPLASADPVTVAAKPAKTEVGVGEPFVVELRAEGPAGTEWLLPPELITEDAELRALPAAQSPAPDGSAPAARYQAVIFSLDKAQVPAIPVRYRLPNGREGEASSEPIALRVVSALPRDPREQSLADIRGPIEVGIGRAFWIALAGALVALAVAGALWWRRRRRAAAPLAAAVPELAPDVEAREALRVLAASGLLAHGAHRAFYIRLTAIAKRYLERRLGAPVLEMTSAETLAFLRGHVLGVELAPAVRDLVDAADRVKFAGADGLAAEAERHLAAAGELVARLETRLRPAPAADGEKVA